MILDMIVRAATPENPSFDLNSPEAWDTFAGGAKASSGETVTRDKALTYAPWWRGINLIASDVGRLPLRVMHVTRNGSDEDRLHPAWLLLRRKPNATMTAAVFKRTLTAHALQTGNGYAYVFRKGDGSPLELVPLDPEETLPVCENGRVWYVTKVKSEQRKLKPEDVLHVKGLCFDGRIGYSVWEYARESLGLGLGARKFGSIFLKNNARPNLALEIPQKFEEKLAKNLRQNWEGIQAGLDNAHRIALLWGGQKLHTFSIAAKDAQLLETRQFEVREIALWLNLPPHKLGDSSRTSYNSLEQENQDYLDTGLDPWLVAWEEACWDALLTEEQKRTESHDVLFHRKALLRANLNDRSNYYQKATGNRPWMTPDEVRDEEDMPLLGGDAAKLKDPMNVSAEPEPDPEPVLPAEEGDEEPVDTPEEADDESDEPPGARAVIEDAARRMVRRLGHAAKAAAGSSSRYLDFVDWLDNKHRLTVIEAFEPAAAILKTSAEAIALLLYEPIKRALSASAEGVTPAKLPEWVERTFADWETTMPAALVNEVLREKR